MVKQDGHIDWMDQIYKDHEKDGGIKNNPGYGKPLPKNLFRGNAYDNFLNTAKNAGYLPPWIKLQKEIREKLSIALKDINEENEQSNTVIQKINEEIKKYNIICPPNMQRVLINLENMKIQFRNWE